jgi:hypothetical protein
MVTMFGLDQNKCFRNTVRKYEMECTNVPRQRSNADYKEVVTHKVGCLELRMLTQKGVGKLENAKPLSADDQ